MRLTIFIKDQQIDLFKDEVIELNSSIANTDDITSINSDYSKTFTVPASENNNQIFKHYYQADIDNTFDSRIKTDGSIKFDGVLFRIGGFRLEKVSVKDNKPDSYTISFAGKLPNIKARLKNDLISSLDLTALDFEFTFANFVQGLSNYGDINFDTGNIIFNLFETKKQYVYDVATNENTDKLVNIAYNGNDRGVDWTSKRPGVRLLKLIEAIETKYDLQFSRQFFSRVDFTQLYMLCFKDSDEIKNGDGPERVTELFFNTDGGTVQYLISENRFWIANYSSPETGSAPLYLKNYSNIFFSVFPSSGFELVPYAIRVYESNFTAGTETLEAVIQAVGTYNYSKSYSSFNTFTQPANSGFTPQPGIVFGTRFEIVTNQAFVFEATTNVEDYSCIGYYSINGTCSLVLNTTGTTGVIGSNSIFSVAKNLPKLKVTDFLKAIFNMFKLVAIPLDDGTIYINTIDEFYKEGKLIDVTKYIDFTTYDVQRGTINNEINFQYEEPTTFLALQFLKNTGIAYGDELFELEDDFGQPLEGDSLEIKLPFEQPIYERLTGTNIQYAYLVNDKQEPTTVKPIIFYNNTVNLSPNELSIMNDGDTNLFDGSINTPSQALNLDVPTTSINWGVEFSSWNFQAINKTLFSEYWRNYILSVFNIKKREFKFSAILPTHILLSLKLNDILFIRERFYKINDFNINLNTRETTLNLINTFDANFGIFSTTNKEFVLDSAAQNFSAYVSNSAVINISFQDLSYDTDWITAVKNGTFIDMTVTENTTGGYRTLFVNANNGEGQEFQISIIQN